MTKEQSDRGTETEHKNNQEKKVRLLKKHKEQAQNTSQHNTQTAVSAE